MADNFSFTEGSGKTGAADDIGGVLYPRVKIAQGSDGSATDVSSAAPLQVTLANSSAIPAGTNNIGDVDVLSIAAGTNTIGAVNVKPTTSGGLDIFRSLDIDETEEEVKATAGQVFGWFISNLASSTRYVKFYNATAANVTVGTTTPVITIPLEADQAANVEFVNGIAFSTAITVAATTGIADNDTGAPGSNEVVINIFYK
jgi:hypothetical protein